MRHARWSTSWLVANFPDGNRFKMHIRLDLAVILFHRAMIPVPRESVIRGWGLGCAVRGDLNVGNQQDLTTIGGDSAFGDLAHALPRRVPYRGSFLKCSTTHGSSLSVLRDP
ncbi:MAG: hypothetical protein C7B43_11555 [Sulfobacillus benefaciens]|uniref:Uncharacterized protein n=1 Tax=Sulfobacillus benefaciens TaxID=453960 RepID=A0A2T2WZC6_9FIRM|nr:MAG: hypothetical protein C7B43_11555 [Sulfobacillus benefaciens]